MVNGEWAMVKGNAVGTLKRPER